MAAWCGARRDFFYDRKNYIGELDIAAEELFNQNRLRIGGLDGQLAEFLGDKLGVTVVIDDGQALNPNSKRLFHPESKTMYLTRWLRNSQDLWISCYAPCGGASTKC